MKPRQLETYSFWWSEARLLIAAVALFIGGVPPIYLIAPMEMFGLARIGLMIAWIISGVTSVYLLYRWYHGGQKLFGKKDSYDTLAFLVMTISGLNLGFAGLFGRNIGMSILSGKVVFLLVGAIYLLVAWHLFQKWNKSGKMF